MRLSSPSIAIPRHNRRGKLIVLVFFLLSLSPSTPALAGNNSRATAHRQAKHSRATIRKTTRRPAARQRHRVRKARRSSGMRRVRVGYRGSAPSMEAAIRQTWPRHLQTAAMNVAWCESRGRSSARNGQYRGHFQIGRKEWAKFGRGNPFNPIDNSAAAYRYYRAVGSWSPWECQP